MRVPEKPFTPEQFELKEMIAGNGGYGINVMSGVDVEQLPQGLGAIRLIQVDGTLLHQYFVYDQNILSAKDVPADVDAQAVHSLESSGYTCVYQSSNQGEPSIFISSNSTLASSFAAA